VIKHSKEIPDPQKYIKIHDWRKASMGKFTKTKKLTYVDEIFKLEKKLPGPASYENTAKRKILGNYKL
jgi:hypothetical protein